MNQNAAAVATDAVGIDAATMRQLGQRGERGVNQCRTGAPVNLRHDAEAAAVVLECLVVQRRAG
jgi:hypothetical protein